MVIKENIVWVSQGALRLNDKLIKMETKLGQRKINHSSYGSANTFPDVSGGGGIPVGPPGLRARVTAPTPCPDGLFVRVPR